ncbi:MAG TPA: LysM peptidoglycan-binding domain-containing protein [Terriglobales bacterium]|nr:LysM peptidoglycan-binding domain-containing protein [Terriglobales bacterium]
MAIVASSSAQSVAEAARQEQARKAKEHRAAQHVYTNDDLKRTQILTPPDEAKVEARRKNSPPPATVQPEKTLDAGPSSGNESLGEIARRYRREKAARDAQDALKKEPASGFSMKLPANSYAVAKPGIAPRNSSSGMNAPRNSPRSMGIPRERRDTAHTFSGIIPGLRTSTTDPMVSRTPRVPSGIASRGRISPFEPRPVLPGRTMSALPSRAVVTAEVAHLERVTVKRGDTYWKFAREYLGHGSRWQELLEINPGASDPRALPEGSALFVPRRGAILTGSSSSSLNAPRSITVRPGDTLWSIARSYFGSGAAWTCLAHSNPQIQNPDLILPGERLSVHSGCGRTP